MKNSGLKTAALLVMVSFGLFAQETAHDSVAAGKEVIAKYIEALGGREAIDGVEDRTTILKVEANGMTMKTITYQKKPGKKRQEIYTGNVEQVIIYDGEKGIQIMAETEREITGEELERLKIESMMNFTLELDSLGIKPVFDGTDTLNGENVNIVELVFPNGTSWTQYYSIATGLKVLEEKMLITPSGNYKQTIYLSNYKSVGGVKYPHKIKQTLNKQELNAEVTKIDVNKGLSDALFEK